MAWLEESRVILSSESILTQDSLVLLCYLSPGNNIILSYPIMRTKEQPSSFHPSLTSTPQLLGTTEKSANFCPSFGKHKKGFKIFSEWLNFNEFRLVWLNLLRSWRWARRVENQKRSTLLQLLWQNYIHWDFQCLESVQDDIWCQSLLNNNYYSQLNWSVKWCWQWWDAVKPRPQTENIDFAFVCVWPRVLWIWPRHPDHWTEATLTTTDHLPGQEEWLGWNKVITPAWLHAFKVNVFRVAKAQECNRDKCPKLMNVCPQGGNCYGSFRYQF